ncbi:MAG TPA: hypothetical protein VKV37_20280 [Ktedonobacteraceae bacterium]|nr:hypothetical protein [Ktedonobacteraceae bacterium]
MAQVAQRPATSHIGPLQIGIILCAVFTACVHLWRGLSMTLLRPSFAGGAPGRFRGPRPGGPGGPGGFGGPPSGASIMGLLPPLPILFYLNFAGYIVLIVALFLPALARYRRIIRWILIFYAALTIVAWYVITHASPNVLAYIDKPIEVALIILLLIDDRQASTHAERLTPAG